MIAKDHRSRSQLDLPARDGREAREGAAEALWTHPRVSLAATPTPFEPLDRLSRQLGGPRIWIKRDDCTGLAGGGNKARKLEFLVADALARGCDTLITAGALQSNHVRQTAAAAARFGLACSLVLTDSVPGQGEAYRQNGNLLLTRLFGARIRQIPRNRESGPVMAAVASELKAAGRNPYVIPVGGSNASGTLGYLAGFEELLGQMRASGISDEARIFLATGSGGTQAGLVLGASVLAPNLRIQGISVGASAARQRARVNDCLAAAAALAGLQDRLRAAPEIRVEDRFVGEGYGLPTPEGIAALRLCARTEGLLLDPVYTGKAMAALFAEIRSGGLSAEPDVVFVHTGGSQALSAYPDSLRDRESHHGIEQQ